MRCFVTLIGRWHNNAKNRDPPGRKRRQPIPRLFKKNILRNIVVANTITMSLSHLIIRMLNFDDSIASNVIDVMTVAGAKLIFRNIKKFCIKKKKRKKIEKKN